MPGSRGDAEKEAVIAKVRFLHLWQSQPVRIQPDAEATSAG